jgi:hypothetical protein
MTTRRPQPDKPVDPKDPVPVPTDPKPPKED